VTELKGVAEGSSLNALSIAAPYIKAFAGVPLKPVSPEVLENELEIARRYNPTRSDQANKQFFLTVSQSGRTSSVVNGFALLQQALGLSESAVSIMPFTNNPEGTLAQRYGNHFPLNAGKEESIAATKSMTASIMALILFGIRTGQANGTLSQQQSQAMVQQLADIPDKLERFLQNPDTHRQISDFAKRLVKPNNYVLLSKGPLSDILPEAGLKLTETSANDVKTYNTEGFRHGPKEILNGVNGVAPNAIYIVPPTLSPEGAEKFFKDVESHYFTDEQPTYGTTSLKRVFFITFENSPPIPQRLVKAFDAKNRILTLPSTKGITDVLESQLTGIVAFQLLSHYLAEAKGKNPNSKGLNKAVV
jgi:glucosamine 6-phosphate synthetase-like amidotransferase/phosphosugar isomerase protein